MNFNVLLLLFFFTNACITFATLSKSDKKTPRHDKKTEKVEMVSQHSYAENNLVTADIHFEDILREHKSFSASQSVLRHFNGEVLAYVTPWNNHGYDIAKLFTTKFTMISPVWFQIKPKNARGSVVIEGRHDIDKKWLLSLKQLNEKIKLVPRVIFESWTYPSLKALLKSQSSTEDAAKELISLAKENALDGFVIEIWSLLGGQMKAELTRMIIHFANSFKRDNLHLILVIPPPSYSDQHTGMFVQQDFENLVDHVTAFSLMSYDYSNFQRPGPNSPIPWLFKCVKELVPDEGNPNRQKLLLGLNFYGNDYSTSGGDSIIGPTYLQILEKHKPTYTYDNTTGEHSFKYSSKNMDHEVYYPTLYSIYQRLQLAKNLGVSIAIWEIGQGLDYFYDLL